MNGQVAGGERDATGDRPGAAGQFGAELTELRVRAGLSVRDLARRTGIPSGSLAGYFSGRHLPPATRPEVLTAIVTACGGSPEDVADWLSRLSALHAGRRRTVAQQPPYRGLIGFGVNDGSLLFGRDGLSRQLTQLVDGCAASGGGIVLVVGPSGTGKSSLLRAGLIPSLLGRDEEAPWTFAMVTPGGDLAETLREAVEDSPPDGRRHLLIIDQMEEAFTLSPDEGELGVLVRHVAHWAAHGTPASPRVAVLSLRADHYGEAAGYPELLEAMRDRQLLVPPMTTEELRSVIEGPAEQVRLKLEWGLADVILADLRAGDLPHALPHLSHTLQSMWEVSDRRTLRIRDYKDVGGVTGAVQKSAERALEELGPVARDIARTLLLQLIVIHPETGPSRRVARRDSLSVQGPAGRQVLDHLVHHRLLTVTEHEVSISHEALIHAWPRLRTWVDEDRTDLTLRELVIRQQRTWQEHRQDPELLLRAGQLETAEDWAQRHPEALTDSMTTYLEASRLHRDQQRREATRQQQRTRRLLVASLILAAIALVAGGLAWRGQQEVAAQRDAAQSRQMAIVASTLRGADIPLANQIAAASVHSADTLQSRSALIDATSLPVLTRRLDEGGVTTAASNGDGSLLALGASDGMVDLVTLTDGVMADAGSIPFTEDETPGPPVTTLSFNSAGDTVAAAGGLAADGHGHIRLVDVLAPGAPAVIADLEVDRAVFAVEFSPDGQHLFAAGDPVQGAAEGAVLRWHREGDSWVADAALEGLDGSVRDVAVGPQGTGLAAVTFSGDVVHWDISGADPALTDTLRIGEGTTSQWSVAFAPAGDLLAVVGKDQTLRLLTRSEDGDLEELTALEVFESWVNTVAFSRDGRLVAAGSSDSTIRLWNLADPASPRLVTVLPVSSPVTSLTSLPGQRFVVTTTDDKSYVWDTTLGTLPLHEAIVFVTRASAEGDRMITAPGVGDGRLYLWDIADPQRPRLLTTLQAPDGLGVADGAGALSADGTRVATGTSTGGVAVWDVSDPADPELLLEHMVSDVLIEQVAFLEDGAALVAVGGDGQISVSRVDAGGASPAAARVQDSPLSVAGEPGSGVFAVGEADGTVTLWEAGDLADGPRATVRTDRAVFGLDFDPTGTRLAVAGADSIVQVFDVTDPATPVETTPPLTGPTTTVYSVEFSPDGAWIAAAALDGTVWVWRRDGDEFTRSAILRSASSSLNAVGWSPDSRHLFAGGHGGETRIWVLDVATAEAYICRTSGDGVTAQEWATHLEGVAYQPPCQGGSPHTT